MVTRQSTYFFILLLLFVHAGCGQKETDDPAFVVRDKEQTGLDFSNSLVSTSSFNMFKYMYFYNGAGVGAGDFNNDGLVDLFFSSNQGQNRLYLNRGKLKFSDVTLPAKIPADGGWSTGVSVVDINNDGLLDIYVSRVGNYEVLKSRNQLLICQGVDKNNVPFYLDKASEYGLDFSGFNTHAAFFDYDADGDLDCFLLNHSIHQNGSFAARENFLGTYHPLSGDRMFRNDGGRYHDVTRETGINSSAISYGLGIAVADIDVDGYPDMYAANDFHENDYLYINQRNGTFKDQLTERIMHTSHYSMGVDIADVNNDALPEIISLDMLPADPYILKRSLGDNDFSTFGLKISYGYSHQYPRNNVQFNRGNGLFSEVGLYSGVAATDWSWAPLWMDFDNDGLKDLFISNGIPKRLNDIDYINHVSSSEVQEKIRNNQMAGSDLELIKQFPQIKLPNKFYRNSANLSFTDMAASVSNDRPTYSNGAVYADLDNDGDQDIVVNNIDDPVLLYENKARKSGAHHFTSVRLQGPAANRNALGAKLLVYSNSTVRTYEKYPVRGFQSSMEAPLHVGLGDAAVDSMLLIWPDNTYQPIQWTVDSTFSVRYQEGLPRFDYRRLQKAQSAAPFKNITQATKLAYRHEENSFVEFDREPLIPFMVSKEGPALAVGDINGDGLEDVFFGASRNKKSAVFLQTEKGTFQRSLQLALDRDSSYEIVDALIADINGDKKNDLVLATGGNEFYGKDEHLLPLLYLNDGMGEFVRSTGAFQGILLTASCIAASDFNGDGAVDLFIGGRAVPWEYGRIPTSYLLQNDGRGNFKNVTAQVASELSEPGFVKGARWADLNGDRHDDLVLSLEWGRITAFIWENGKLKKRVLAAEKGWWNFVLPCDVDGDGDVDLIAGNQGLNNKFQPTPKEPVQLYYNDFDDNGKKEQVITYYLQGRQITFHNKDELQMQVPMIRKRFLLAADFAKASLEDIFSEHKLAGSAVSSADYFGNCVLLNDGKLNFTVVPLPWQAQLSTYKDAAIVDANKDELPDVLLVGNFYENNVQMGRSDADYGTLLINRGKGNFTAASMGNMAIKGQVRHIRPIRIGSGEAFVLARNNDSAIVLQQVGE